MAGRYVVDVLIDGIMVRREVTADLATVADAYVNVLTVGGLIVPRKLTPELLSLSHPFETPLLWQNDNGELQQVKMTPAVLDEIGVNFVVFDAKTSDTGPPTFDAASSPVDKANFLDVGSGRSRALVVGLVFNDATIPPDLVVVWDQGGTNQAMTQIAGAVASQSVGFASNAVLFGLVAPTSGLKTLRVAWSNGTFWGYICGISFTRVNQAGGDASFANGAGNSNSGDASAISTVTIASSVNDAIVAAHVDNGASPGAGTIVSDTQLSVSHAGGVSNFASNYAVGTGTQALTATWASNRNWAAVGANVVAE